MSSYQYRISHCGDKTVVRMSNLHNGSSYTGKTTSLYWIGAQDQLKWSIWKPWSRWKNNRLMSIVSDSVNHEMFMSRHRRNHRTSPKRPTYNRMICRTNQSNTFSALINNLSIGHKIRQTHFGVIMVITPYGLGNINSSWPSGLAKMGHF